MYFFECHDQTSRKVAFVRFCLSNLHLHKTSVLSLFKSFPIIKMYMKFILVKGVGTNKSKVKGHWTLWADLSSIWESSTYELMGSHALKIILCSMFCFCLSGVYILFADLDLYKLWEDRREKNFNLNILFFGVFLKY